MNDENKKYLIVSGAVFLLILGYFFMSVSANNTATRYELNIPKETANLKILENRKINLFNNIVETIKTSTTREQEILTSIVELRENGESDSSAISITAEAYPELKSIEGYNYFLTEMSLTENGISTKRESINNMITDYNTMFYTIPSKWFLSGRNMVEFQLFNYDVNADEWKADWEN